ncbi:MAG TPA: hypothetical protein VG964_04230 [Candidatus Saccharimonadales bacterium]|nr:hypothetical protein [Candidatus Saccharimonadales bacterium]
MLSVEELPSIDELHDLIDSVNVYPVSARELSELAVAEGAGRRVVDFYRSFPSDQLFLSENDLTARSEQIQIMSIEEIDQPWEIQRSPQE